VTRQMPEPGLALASVMGFCVGVGTAATVGALYPPAKDHLWPIGSVAGTSIGLVLALYLTAARLDVRRAGDWLVVGYTVALVLAASFAVSREAVQAFRDHVPQSAGVKTTAASRVQWPMESIAFA
jgi:hypothetical protein